MNNHPTPEQMAELFPMANPIKHLKITTATGKTIAVLKLARRDPAADGPTTPDNLTVSVEALPARNQKRTGWLAVTDPSPGDYERIGYRRPRAEITSGKLVFPKWTITLDKALPALARIYDSTTDTLEERHFQALLTGQR